MKQKLTAKQTIQQALHTIMDDGEANACQVWRGTAYSGAGERTGWHFQRFGATPTFLGQNLPDALVWIEATADQESNAAD